MDGWSTQVDEGVLVQQYILVSLINIFAYTLRIVISHLQENLKILMSPFKIFLCNYYGHFFILLIKINFLRPLCIKSNNWTLNIQGQIHSFVIDILYIHSILLQCGSGRSVAPIKAGFVARIGRRKPGFYCLFLCCLPCPCLSFNKKLVG